MQTSAEESLAAESDRHPSRDLVRLDVGVENQAVQADTRDQALRPFDRDRNLPAAAELERFHAANNAGSGTLLSAGSACPGHAGPDLRGPGRGPDPVDDS